MAAPFSLVSAKIEILIQFLYLLYLTFYLLIYYSLRRLTDHKRRLSAEENPGSKYPQSPSDDDDVFYPPEQKRTRQDDGNSTSEFDNPEQAQGDYEDKDRLHSSGEDKPSDVPLGTSQTTGRIPPMELLLRLFPIQKRSVLELILKGCHGNVLQAIECILPSHEKVLAVQRGLEPSMLHYSGQLNPYHGMPSAFFAHQSRPGFQGTLSHNSHSIYGPPSCPYPSAIVDYMSHKRCAISNCSSSSEGHARSPYPVHLPPSEQTNAVGAGKSKVCPECSAKCSPTNNFCNLCGKSFKGTWIFDISV